MRKQMSTIVLLLITVFIGFGVIIPVMPEVVSERHLGWMLALYSAASFVMSPVWGGLSDRYGRKPIMIIGMAGFSISFFIFGMALDNLWLMYASRLIGGLFSGAVTSCAVAYVADITDEENRTRGMGMVGMAIGLGFIIGPAIGGLLSTFSLSIPFFASSSLALVTLFFCWVLLEESLDENKRRMKAAGPRASRWTAFQGALKHLYALVFIVSFTLAGLESVLQYFQRQAFGAGPTHIGVMLLISGIVGAAVQGGIIRRLVKQGMESRVIVIGLTLSAAGFFLLLASDSFFTATVYLCVFAAGNALVRPCVTSLITQKTKVGQGAASGLSSSMDSLGRIAGPLFGTLLFTVDHALPFLLCGVICLASLFFVFRFLRQSGAAAETV
jgi:multidrug resistance protein